MAKQNLLVLCFVTLLLAACGTSPIPTPATAESVRGTSTPLPPPPTWTEPSTPITVENIQSLRLLGRLETPGEPATIFAYALSPDNTRLAALDNNYLIVWDLVTGREVFYMTRGDETRVYYSPAKDEIYALGASGAIYILNSETGALEDTLIGQGEYSGLVDYHADLGLMALVSSTGEIRVWEMFERVALATLTGNGAPVTMVDFSQDGERLVAGYENGAIQVWDWRSRTPLTTLVTEGFPLVTQIRFSPDDRSIVGTTASTGIVWDAQSGAQQHTLPIESGGSNFLFKFVPQESYLMTGGLAQNTTLWNIETGALASALPGIGANNLDAAFSPDGDLLFTTVYESGVALWNLTNIASGSIARSTQSFENQNILNLEWTSDGFLVLMFDARGPVEVWGIP